MNESRPDPILSSEGLINTLNAPIEWMEQLTTWIKTHPLPQSIIQTLRNMGL